MLRAALSPDGHHVAFSSPSNGIFQVFVMLTAGGDPLQLTKDEGDKLVDSFSADGTEIYYSRTLGQDEAWAIATLGGTPHRVASGVGLVPASDGSTMFFMKRANGAIYRVGKSGLGEEEVFRFDNASISPGAVLPFPNNPDLLVEALIGLEYRFYKVNVAAHSAVDLGPSIPVEVFQGRPAWLEPGETVLFERTVNGITNLWSYGLKNQEFTRITTGPGPDSSPMPDPSGKGIYYVSGRSSSFLTAYRVRDRSRQVIVADGVSQPMISPDARRVMYARYLEAGRSEVWASEIDGSNSVKLTGGGIFNTLDWSPDSSQVAFADGGHLYVTALNGRGPREVKSIEGSIGMGTWSSDGKRLFISAFRKGEQAIWTINADGSNAETLLVPGFALTAASPGGYLLGRVSSGPHLGIYQMSTADKQQTPLLPGVETYMLRFAPDYKSFLYAVAGRGEMTFNRQGWRDGSLVGTPQVALRVPFDFPLAYKGNGFDFSRDLSLIVYTQPGGQHDLYLLSKSR